MKRVLMTMSHCSSFVDREGHQQDMLRPCQPLAFRSRNTCRRARCRTRHGLTLLEMLLVVFILAAVALSAVSLVDRADEQLRYEETQQRLTAVEQAVVGVPTPSYQGQRLLTGFVADLGHLPDDLKSFINPGPTQFAPFGPIHPDTHGSWIIYDPQPDVATGLNDGPNSGSGAVVELTDTTPGVYNLSKGYRGPYLASPPGSVFFRDGWGNVASDPAVDLFTHGWTIASTPRDVLGNAAQLGIASTGSDGQPDALVAPQDVYQEDVGIEIDANQWTLPVSSITVEVTNNTGGELQVSGGTALFRASLLVYVDSERPNAWVRFTSENGHAALATDETAQFSFAPVPSGEPTRVPIGEHLLVLVMDADGTRHTIDDAPFEHEGRMITRRVALFPRTTPALQLSIP